MRDEFRNEIPMDFSIEENRIAMQRALDTVSTQLGQRYPLVINGERIETGEWITSINPGNLDQTVGEVARATAEHVDQAIAAAGEAYTSWRKMSAEGRASVAFKLAGLLRKHRLELSAWMAYELDKAWDEAEGEVCEAIDMMEWNGREMLRLSQHMSFAHLPNEANSYHYLPMGVGAIIPPWNFPLAIFTNMTMAPVIAGNTVVVKPASNTPVIGYKMIELMEEAGVPPGVVNFLPGGGEEIGDAMVDDPRVSFVAFTGSQKVGVRIYERAAKVHPGQRWLKRVTAEMGGKDAIIVDSSANLDDAAQGIVGSAFGFQGQKCSACSRAIIHKDVYDEVVEKVVALTEQSVTHGPAHTGEHTVGAVVDEKQFKSIKEYIEVGKKEGRLAFQADAVEDKGYFVPPTVFADMPADSRVACEEIFGPVLALVKARDFDHALDIANSSEYGLTGSVYSRNRAHLEQARYQFDVGNLYFNRGCTGAFMGVHPFGGMKMSGTNTKSGGPDYLQNFMVAKAVGERV
ncbi:MAG: L-glutamate gamma-semialdehyde dehydrogenase [Chloroflexia bacterium]|nr:L-glutamate gamma-semialdehyde dehydrogenase [Chloroflexia bacterium]MDQ3526248.1 L-glutamate gamma-semialdehyde dehydrogenase [Chloroflexota bacterium]